MADQPGGEAAVAAAFDAAQSVQNRMSAFDPVSDIGRFNAARRGDCIEVAPETARVLQAAQELFEFSEGCFDAARGTGVWAVLGQQLMKLGAFTQLDLGGIAKGYAVDVACEALMRQGVVAGWVNAGGDLRSFGLSLPVALRNEVDGGMHPWLDLRDAALATSYFGEDQPRRLHGAVQVRHVSVQAPQCLWADGLTKIIALQGRADEALMRRYHAQAWLHSL